MFAVFEKPRPWVIAAAERRLTFSWTAVILIRNAHPLFSASAICGTGVLVTLRKMICLICDSEVAMLISSVAPIVTFFLWRPENCI